MIFMQANSDEIETTLIVVVLETDNLQRMTKADPVTLESMAFGGMIAPIKYPERVRLLIAHEEDAGPIYEMIRDHRDGDLLAHLMRGYKFTAIDGKATAVRRGEA